MIESIKTLLDGDWCQEVDGVWVELEEKKANMVVKIKGLSREGILIYPKKHESDKWHPVIIDKKKKNYGKSCDYLFLMPNTKCIDVYFIELKKTISGKNDPELSDKSDQILFTIPVWEYLVSMVDIHFDKKPRIKKSRIKKHFVVIAEQTSNEIAKQTISPEPQPYRHKNRKFKLAYSPGGVALQSLK